MVKYLSPYLYFVFRYLSKIVIALVIKHIFFEAFCIYISTHFFNYFAHLRWSLTLQLEGTSEDADAEVDLHHDDRDVMMRQPFSGSLRK